MQKSPAKPISKLEQKLGYVFKNRSYLEQALTHRSKHSQNNERLEFLGDAVLGFVIAAQLYDRFPSASEGELSRCRASLVKGATLAEFGKELELGDYLQLGPGELKSGGFRRESTLTDAFEAIVGAIHLDGEFAMAQEFIIRVFKDRLEALDLEVVMKDPKTLLQEYMQSKHYELPRYDVVETSGKDHQQTFVVHCYIELFSEAIEGKGKSRRKAEQQAAKSALKQLNKLN